MAKDWIHSRGQHENSQFFFSHTEKAIYSLHVRKIAVFSKINTFCLLFFYICRWLKDFAMAFLLVNDELKCKIVTALIPTEDKLYKVYSYLCDMKIPEPSRVTCVY